jgi:hypothetical protein
VSSRDAAVLFRKADHDRGVAPRPAGMDHPGDIRVIVKLHARHDGLHSQPLSDVALDEQSAFETRFTQEGCRLT